MSDSGHRPILPNPGVELVFEMVREWARGQECGRCGHLLDGCLVPAGWVEAGRVTVAIRCTGCGVIFSAMAAPMSDGGAAVIR